MDGKLRFDSIMLLHVDVQIPNSQQKISDSEISKYAYMDGPKFEEDIVFVVAVVVAV